MPVLGDRVDGAEGSQHRTIGRLDGAYLEPGPDGAVEESVVIHASRPSRATGASSTVMAVRSDNVA